MLLPDRLMLEAGTELHEQFIDEVLEDESDDDLLQPPVEPPWRSAAMVREELIVGGHRGTRARRGERRRIRAAEGTERAAEEAEAAGEEAEDEENEVAVEEAEDKQGEEMGWQLLVNQAIAVQAGAGQGGGYEPTKPADLGPNEEAESFHECQEFASVFGQHYRVQSRSDKADE